MAGRQTETMMGYIPSLPPLPRPRTRPIIERRPPIEDGSFPGEQMLMTWDAAKREWIAVAQTCEQIEVTTHEDAERKFIPTIKKYEQLDFTFCIAPTEEPPLFVRPIISETVEIVVAILFAAALLWILR